MNCTDEVTGFINELGKSKFPGLVDMIKQDVEKCSKDITKMVLRNSLQFEANWTSYTLSDINICYEEDMLKVNDMLKMYGIRKSMPTLKENDKALITNYQYTLFDAFGGIMDIVNLFHTTIKGAVGDDDIINEWFILCDL